MHTNRRTFLLAGGGAAAATAMASDRIRLGVIGGGGRGNLVMSTFQKDKTVQVGAVCDVYEPNLERTLSAASKAQGAPATAYRNYKELLSDKTIDAVLIATPEHWHAQMTLDAMAAGKVLHVPGKARFVVAVYGGHQFHGLGEGFQAFIDVHGVSP